MAIKYYFEVLKIKDLDWSKVELTSGGSGIGSAQSMSGPPANPPGIGAGPAPNAGPAKKISVPSLPSAPQVPKTKEKCPVCDEMMFQPALLLHVAQHHFSHLLAAHKVPTCPPFKCVICPFHSEDYAGILRHILVFHKAMDTYTEALKSPQDPVKVRHYGLSIDNITIIDNGIVCRI